MDNSLDFDSIFPAKEQKKPRKAQQPRQKPNNMAEKYEHRKEVVPYIRDFLGIKDWIHIASENPPCPNCHRIDWGRKHDGSTNKDFPDFMLLVPSENKGKYKLLFIELKQTNPKKGITREGQLAMLEKLNNIESVHAFKAQGSLEAMNILNSFYGIEIEPF